MVLLDESGFMLQPLVRRTWAPRGQTPVLRQWARHDRISAISALTVAPQRRRIGLYWSLQERNICGDDLVLFLRRLRGHLRRGIVLVWDRWSVHKSAVVRRYLTRHQRTIQVEWLPGYAPDLNPTEQVWNHAKYSDLANEAPPDTDDLARRIRGSLRGQRRDRSLLRSFFKTAGLPL